MKNIKFYSGVSYRQDFENTSGGLLAVHKQDKPLFLYYLYTSTRDHKTLGRNAIIRSMKTSSERIPLWKLGYLQTMRLLQS